MGDYNGACIDFDKLLCWQGLADTDRAWTLVNRSVARMKLSQFDSAIDDCTQVLSLHNAPEEQRLKALINRAQARKMQEAYQEAIVDCSSALSMKPEPFQKFRVLYFRGNLYLEIGNLHKSLEDLETCLHILGIESSKQIKLAVKKVEKLIAQKQTLSAKQELARLFQAIWNGVESSMSAITPTAQK